MKKTLCILLAAVLLLGLCACGQKSAEPAEPEKSAEWTRQGYFADEDENMLSVTWMEDIDQPGWYVACMLGEDPIEDSYGGTLNQEGAALRGTLTCSGEKEALTVTVSQEGEGLLLSVEGGESRHFLPMDLPDATIFVTVDTEGMGNIAFAEGEAAPEIDPERPYQSAVINLAEPTPHTLVAWPQAGNVFVKWTKDGEDFSTEPQITVTLDESAAFVAVFEADPAWQNLVMNLVGDYQSGRANAMVASFGDDEVWIVIEWGGSAWELARWNISGRLDPDTLTVSYSDCSKQVVVFEESGEIKSEETVYQNGTGTVTFSEDGHFTWHEDQSESGEDLVFDRLPAMGEEDEVGLANPWRSVTEEEARELYPVSFSIPEGAENVGWSVMEAEGAAPLLQLTFDLNDNAFTAREQKTDDGEADIAGMYYTWTDQREEALKNWADGKLTAKLSRFMGENEWADLCTWYDPETGVSYSLSVAAEDLDGFDLLALAEQLRP